MSRINTSTTIKKLYRHVLENNTSDLDSYTLYSIMDDLAQISTSTGRLDVDEVVIFIDDYDRYYTATGVGQLADAYVHSSRNLPAVEVDTIKNALNVDGFGRLSFLRNNFLYMDIYTKKHRREKTELFHRSARTSGGGKYSVAGCYEIPAIAEMIRFYNYDYGMQLAKLGYVVLCPDSRGLGERRDETLQNDDETSFLNSTCFHLAHMAEPLGQTVAGMCTWDLMRLIDYIEERDEWRTDTLGCLGFSGGGMQTLWLAALDERVRQAVISGYMYGYRDSLLKMNGNCSCNYVPGLWEHVDMGDIGSLIAPRPLMVQSCTEDPLNGERGIINVMEQMEVIRSAYRLFEMEDRVVHDICAGGHCWHGEKLEEVLKPEI